jgi:hypothetical protein
MDPEDAEPRDTIIGRLFDTLAKAQQLAELAGLTVMAGQLREMRRRTHVALLLRSPESEDDAAD